MRVWRSTLGNKSRKEKAIPFTPERDSAVREQLLVARTARRSSFQTVGTAYTVNGFLKDIWPNAR